MKKIISDEQKILLLANDTKCNDIVYAIQREDIQIESINRLHRILNDNEVEQVKELIDWGINESINNIYNTAFLEIANNDKF